jgi:hypothetical protein
MQSHLALPAPITTVRHWCNVSTRPRHELGRYGARRGHDFNPVFVDRNGAFQRVMRDSTPKSNSPSCMPRLLPPGPRGLQAARKGFPSRAEGIPSRSEGIPSQSEGIPSQSEGIPNPAEGNPNLLSLLNSWLFNGLSSNPAGLGVTQKLHATPINLTSCGRRRLKEWRLDPVMGLR